MLTPIFENMPRELTQFPRWVCWKGKKVPIRPTKGFAPADVTDPTSWGSFDQAKAVFQAKTYAGVGFVLNGDGITGIDIDHCVSDGVVADRAKQIVADLGCGYVELSPSGTGVHGFGFADDIRSVRGRVDGTNVELYGTGRYLTMTGHVITSGPLAPLRGISTLVEQIRSKSREVIRDGGEIESVASVSSVTSVASVASVSSVSSVGQWHFPDICYPSGTGHRNQAIFQLARYLKGTMPDAATDTLLEAVRAWHTQAMPVIGTQDFGVTWADFINAWAKVKQPYGKTLNAILSDLPPLPAGSVPEPYGSVGRHLMRICIALQSHYGSEPFFLSARQCGDLLGIHFTDANKYLSAFATEGLLRVVSRGAGRKASRYMVSI